MCIIYIYNILHYTVHVYVYTYDTNWPKITQNVPPRSIPVIHLHGLPWHQSVGIMNSLRAILDCWILFIQYSWKWKMAAFERELITIGRAHFFHFHDYGRKGISVCLSMAFDHHDYRIVMKLKVNVEKPIYSLMFAQKPIKQKISSHALESDRWE